jgi:alcohol dehydrogenase
VVLSPYFVAPENVDEPAQILIGLTSIGPASAQLQADWPDGTLAQFALAPASTVAPVEGLERLGAAQLAVLNRAIVPFGGLLRGRLAAGETLVVNGATGAYGTAAVLLGLAMGAAKSQPSTALDGAAVSRCPLPPPSTAVLPFRHSLRGWNQSVAEAI